MYPKWLVCECPSWDCNYSLHVLVVIIFLLSKDPTARPYKCTVLTKYMQIKIIKSEIGEERLYIAFEESEIGDGMGRRCLQLFF